MEVQVLRAYGVEGGNGQRLKGDAADLPLNRKDRSLIEARQSIPAMDSNDILLILAAITIFWLLGESGEAYTFYFTIVESVSLTRFLLSTSTTTPSDAVWWLALKTGFDRVPPTGQASKT